MESEKIPYHRPMKLDFTIPEDILESGMLSNNKYTKYLEYKIGKLYNKEYVLACSSCTQGLLIALSTQRRAYTVHMPAFNWLSDRYIVEMRGSDISYYDIDQDTWLMEPKLNHGLKLAVHTFGNVCEVEGSFVIYDASHALGSKIKEWGDITVFSMAPTKLITSCEGGIIITDDEKLYTFMKEVRDRCSRMPEFSAAYGLVCLSHLEEVKKWKKKVYNYYKKRINGIFQKIPYASNYNTIGFLNINNLKIPEEIDFRKYYIPLFRGLRNTEFVYENIVCLPSYFNCNYKLITDMINDAKQI